MKIIKVKKKGSVTASKIMALTGARFEDTTLKGISHFVEHMCFKGTKNRSHKDIAQEIERFGGIINAYTGWESTAYWVKTANRDKDIALNIIKDMTKNSIFPETEIDKERQVILQELKMNKDSPARHVWEELNKKLYKNSSGLYLPIIGTKTTLQNIKKEQLLKYYKNKYRNLVLIQVGDVKNKDDFSINKTESKQLIPEISLKNIGKKYLIGRKGVTQANVLISNEVLLDDIPKINREAIFSLLQAIYSGMAGRLYLTIREKHNLVYQIHFYYEQYKNGMIKWDVFFALSADKINDAYDLIVEQLTKPIGLDEIDYALTRTIGLDTIRLDNVLNAVNIIAYCVTNGLDYRKVLKGFETRYKKIAKSINEYQKRIDFKKNVLVGLVPERKTK